MIMVHAIIKISNLFLFMIIIRLKTSITQTRYKNTRVTLEVQNVHTL